jgi:hypothetical protein
MLYYGVNEDSYMSWERQQTEAAPSIAGDRREDRRYGLHLECRWKLIRRRRVLDTGTGRTIDLSSGGLSFDAGRHLPEGLNVEISVTWPVLLHNVAPLQLVISGRIVRSNGRQIAVRTVQHEFRTALIHAEARTAAGSNSRSPAIPPNSPIFATLGKML